VRVSCPWCGLRYRAAAIGAGSDESIADALVGRALSPYLDKTCDGLRMHNHALALQIAAYHTDVWLQPGIIDVIGNVSVPSMTATRQANIAAFTALGKRVWLSTMQPANASSNSWIDLAGQTPGAHDANRVSVNTDTRGGLVYTTAAGFFEFANLVEHALNDGDWKFDGTTFKYTGDGAHLTAFSVALTAGLFTLP